MGGTDNSLGRIVLTATVVPRQVVMRISPKVPLPMSVLRLKSISAGSAMSQSKLYGGVMRPSLCLRLWPGAELAPYCLSSFTMGLNPSSCAFARGVLFQRSRGSRSAPAPSNSCAAL